MTHREGKLRTKDRQKKKEQLRSDIITGDRECREGVRLSHCRLDPLVAPVNGDGAVCGLALKPRHHAAACSATDAELLVCLPSCRSRRFQGCPVRAELRATTREFDATTVLSKDKRGRHFEQRVSRVLRDFVWSAVKNG